MGNNEIATLTHFQYSEATIRLLAPQEARIIRNAQTSEANPRLTQLNQLQIKKLLDSIQLKVKVKLARTAAREVSAIDAENTVINADLMKNFPSLTVKEVYAALDNGLDGLYLSKPTDDVYFSPANLVKWIHLYIILDKKPAIINANKHQELFDKRQDAIHEVDQYSLYRDRFDRLSSMVWDTRNGQTPIDDIGGGIYQLLVQFEKIKPIEAGSIEMESAAQTMLDRSIANFDRGNIGRNRRLLTSVMKGNMENDVFSHACLKHVNSKIREIAKWEQADIKDFFDLLRENILEYFNENNITKP